MFITIIYLILYIADVKSNVSEEAIHSADATSEMLSALYKIEMLLIFLDFWFSWYYWLCGWNVHKYKNPGSQNKVNLY